MLFRSLQGGQQRRVALLVRHVEAGTVLHRQPEDFKRALYLAPLAEMVRRIDRRQQHRASRMVPRAGVGLAVEQQFHQARIALRDGLHQGSHELAQWLIQHEVEEVVMESTAQYWKPVWRERRCISLPAAVYFVDLGQVSLQVPSGVSGTASVQVTNNRQTSNTVTAPAAASSPGIFPVIVNGTNYPAGVFPALDTF